VNFWQATDFALEILSEEFRADTEAGKQRRHNAIRLLDERLKEMHGLDRLVFVARGNAFCRLQRLLCFHGHFVETQHDSSLPWFAEEKGLARVPAPMLTH